jgi:DNA-binding CsgD family transcriptional regulator
MAVKSIEDSIREPAPSDAGVYKTLVRQLVAHAGQPMPASSVPVEPGNTRNSGPDDVLLECEVDGVRYMLVRAQPAAPVDSVSLSPREYEIARMIAKGYPNKVIASVLEISVWTVSTHLRRIFAKLRVTSRTAMVARMFENGNL